MTPAELVEQLLALPDHAAQRQWLAARTALLDEAFTEALKEQVFQLQRANIQAALQAIDLIHYTAALTGNPRQRALGLRIEAQARAIGLGEYQPALDLYAQAAQIYQAQNDQLSLALMQVTRIWPLACLGRYTDAFEAGRWAADILQAQAQWYHLTNLQTNLAAIQGRLGEDSRALEMLDAARAASWKLGPAGDKQLAHIEQNRGIVLRNLGRFEASLQASQTAWEMNTRLGQKMEAAQAQQSLGITYFLLGRYTEALGLLDQARDFFVTDGRERHAVLADLFVGDCLLQLRRFNEALDRSQRAQTLFTSLGTRFEVAQAKLNQALAYAGLRRYAEALPVLSEARDLLAAENNPTWVATVDLEQAAVLSQQGQPAASLPLAQTCAAMFHEQGIPLKEAQAYLVAAQAALDLRQLDPAAELIHSALAIAERQPLPALLASGHHLLSSLATLRQDLPLAFQECAQAIQALEQLRGRLMVEFRAGFLEDKQVYYEDAVNLCLALEQPRQGWEYAERAKSRALLDIVTLRLDLSLKPRRTADRPLTEELTRLCAERDRLYRRQASGEEIFERGPGEAWAAPPPALALEQRITELWHTLLVRDADYARDAALSQVRVEPIQPYLAADTLVVEYFIARERLIVFLVSAESITAQYLPVEMAALQNRLQWLWHNLKAVSPQAPARLPALTQNAQGLLYQLYQDLLAPLEAATAPYRRLIIVPHGWLHYLPFHALYTGRAYALERHEISYLPSASFLNYGRQDRSTSTDVLAMGHSYGGCLPYTLSEARAVADLWQTRPWLETQATLARLRPAAADCRVLHLAAHGDFRADNPLFSGLALADGWLTTLEVFNLRLNASLVTLSGCQTGRCVVGGGDELLGLTRACLYAGAASLVLSQWAIEDNAAAQLMQFFYQNLLAGQTKGAALRQAQLQFLDQATRAAEPGREHPYFWAPFFLIGAAGPL